MVYDVNIALILTVFTFLSMDIVSAYGDYSTNQELYENAELLFSQR